MLPGDIETLVFGLAATILAAIAIYVTRRRELPISETQDSELGILNNTSTSSQAWTTPAIVEEPEEERVTTELNSSSSTILDRGESEQPNQILEVIGETLEVFSRHLRSHRSNPPAAPTDPLHG